MVNPTKVVPMNDDGTVPIQKKSTAAATFTKTNSDQDPSSTSRSSLSRRITQGVIKSMDEVKDKVEDFKVAVVDAKKAVEEQTKVSEIRRNGCGAISSSCSSA
jgi:hypothetical protein